MFRYKGLEVRRVYNHHLLENTILKHVTESLVIRKFLSENSKNLEKLYNFWKLQGKNSKQLP